MFQTEQGGPAHLECAGFYEWESGDRQRHTHSLTRLTLRCIADRPDCSIIPLALRSPFHLFSHKWIECVGLCVHVAVCELVCVCVCTCESVGVCVYTYTKRQLGGGRPAVFVFCMGVGFRLLDCLRINPITPGHAPTSPSPTLSKLHHILALFLC